MTVNQERIDRLMTLARERADARLRRVQAVLWSGNRPPPGLVRLSDDEFTAFTDQQKAMARREMDGAEPGTAAQRFLGESPAAAEVFDGEVIE